MATVGKKKGSSKSGGRKKGTLNKVNATVTERLANLNCDPIEGMAEIAITSMSDGDYHLAFQCFKELGQYVAPKRKSIELSGEVGFKEIAQALTDAELDEELKGYGLDPAKV